MTSKNCKYIFVTGGVCSGLGKGIAAASTGAILKACNFKVFSLKLDPYLNLDPGTMNPYQHGEVFVLDDGTETDLDLGHYERFMDENLNKLSNLTTGQVYDELLSEERQGKYLGKTIQIIPHITNKIKERIYQAAEISQADFLIMEIGGTVGDIEGEPFLETVRQLHNELGSDKVMIIHVALLPYLKVSHELKTKPVQASVRELRGRGIQPDIILARADYPVSKENLEKISLFCDIPIEAVIPAPTIKSIYEVPINLEKSKISEIIFKKFNIRKRVPDLKPWKSLVKKMKNGKDQKTVNIVMVGKYTEHGDAYISIIESLKAAAAVNNTKMKVEWVVSEKLENKDKKEWAKLKSANGILIPGGFGSRGTEGKILAAKYARENNIPYFGLCLGMQIATIEFARNIAKIKNANSTEFDIKTENPVIHIMPEQEKKMLSNDYGASMRLGSWPCKLVKGTISYKSYNKDKIDERHRHRFEFNNKYREQLENEGLKIAGTSPDGLLVEIVEIPSHPWFVAVQFHPEFKSRPLRPHPLFRDFVKACVNHNK
ncbi:MAG: CTP synthase [Candidatus Kerfeldbacteria bacterium]